MNDERSPSKLDQGLVRSHAARPSPGEHKTRGLWLTHGLGPTQLAASSKNRMSDSIPSAKFFK